MHTTSDLEGLLDGISYGFSLERLFFRLDYIESLMPYKETWSFTLYLLHPKELKIFIDIKE